MFHGSSKTAPVVTSSHIFTHGSGAVALIRIVRPCTAEGSVTWLNSDRSCSGTGGWKSVGGDLGPPAETLKNEISASLSSRQTSESSHLRNSQQWTMQPMTDPINLRVGSQRKTVTYEGD